MKTDPQKTLVALLLATGLALSPLPSGADDRARGHQPEHLEPVLNKPDPAPGKASRPALVVNEGGLARPLWIDTTRVAEFPDSSDQPALRPAQAGELGDGSRGRTPGAAKTAPAASGTAGPTGSTAVGSASTGSPAGGAALSPVFVDASGRPRALPGGIIVTLRGLTPPAAARAELQAAGLTPLRQIGERMWLVESQAGLPTLELATRLHDEGRFEFVQPNWWNTRTTKGIVSPARSGRSDRTGS